MAEISKQLAFEFDLLELDEPLVPRPKREKPVCVCGAQAASKIQPYQKGHSTWCKVHEDVTPII